MGKLRVKKKTSIVRGMEDVKKRPPSTLVLIGLDGTLMKGRMSNMVLELIGERLTFDKSGGVCNAIQSIVDIRGVSYYEKIRERFHKTMEAWEEHNGEVDSWGTFGKMLDDFVMFPHDEPFFGHRIEAEAAKHGLLKGVNFPTAEYYAFKAKLRFGTVREAIEENIGNDMLLIPFTNAPTYARSAMVKFLGGIAIDYPNVYIPTKKGMLFLPVRVEGSFMTGEVDVRYERAYAFIDAYGDVLKAIQKIVIIDNSKKEIGELLEWIREDVRGVNTKVRFYHVEDAEDGTKRMFEGNISQVAEALK